MIKAVLEILNMGGYARYVWPCYVLLLSVIFWQMYSTIRKNRIVVARIKAELQLER